MLTTADHMIEGVQCAVYDSDPGRREAVVFVHGNPGPMDDWEDLIPEIAPFARAVAMDMPGYGRAEHPRKFDYSIDGYARYLGKLLDHLSVDRAHLVLHDFGGPWGLRWGLGKVAGEYGDYRVDWEMFRSRQSSDRERQRLGRKKAR